MIDSKKLTRAIEKERIAEILKESREHWSRFHLLRAYRERLRRDPEASFNSFLAEVGLPESVDYAETEGHNILLWHATFLRHVEKILEHGFFQHGGGVYFSPATHALPLQQSAAIAGSFKREPDEVAILACVLDEAQCVPGKDYIPSESEYRFPGRVGPSVVFAVVTNQAVKFVGHTRKPKDGVTPAKFVRKDGWAWGIPSRNPRHLHGGRFYETPQEWLDCFLEYLFRRHSALTIFELLNAVRMNVEPPEALPLDDILETLRRQCRFARKTEKGVMLERDL